MGIPGVGPLWILGPKFATDQGAALARSSSRATISILYLVSRDAMKSRILVIDDARENADTLAKLLGILGQSARVAYGGMEGIDVAAEFLPDMAFIDIGMPGIDGYETATTIKKHPECSHTILVALTGYTQPEDKHRAYAAGFDLHVSKPMGVDTLQELLSILNPEAKASTIEKLARFATASPSIKRKGYRHSP